MKKKKNEKKNNAETNLLWFIKEDLEKKIQ